MMKCQCFLTHFSKMFKNNSILFVAFAVIANVSAFHIIRWGDEESSHITCEMVNLVVPEGPFEKIVTFPTVSYRRYNFQSENKMIFNVNFRNQMPMECL